MGQDDKFYSVFASVRLDSVEANTTGPNGTPAGSDAWEKVRALFEEVGTVSEAKWTGSGTGCGDQDAGWQVQGTSLEAWNTAFALANALDQAIGTACWVGRVYVVKYEGGERSVVRDVRLNGHEVATVPWAVT